MAEEEPPRVDPHATALLHRLRALEGLSREELDELPYGVIQVDRSGRVLAYNQAEAELAGLEPAAVVGKNFFADVAPCTDVQSFAGRLREAFELGAFQESFPFMFRFPTGPVFVTISFCRSAGEDHAWILVDPAEG